MDNEDSELFNKSLKPKKDAKQAGKLYTSGDGVQRTPAVEHQLNEAFAIVFAGAAGELVLDYLRSISTFRVLGPGHPDTSYTYHEGARWLMGIIDRRVKDGEEKKP